MSRTAIDEFVVGFKVQREWGWLILTAFFLGGVGGGLFMVSVFNDFVAGMIAGLVVVVAGKGTAHLLFLGRPERFWRMLRSPGSSWISRGVYFMLAFTMFGVLQTLPYLDMFNFLPWGPETALGKIFQVLALVSAALLVMYTGFVMAYSPAIQFWATPLLPALFGLYALSAGTASIFVMLPFVGEGSLNVKSLENLETILVIGAVAFLAMYLFTMLYSTLGAKEAVRMLTTGQLSLVFWCGVVAAGLIVPAVLAVYVQFGLVPAAQAIPLMAVAGVFELVGGFLLRSCLLRAGVFAPVF